ncbi:aminopeptidase P family protein [candidate division KSB1 bacterium]|nr:aminopeptidase P family protein [candidate division KSB1 bacterium]
MNRKYLILALVAFSLLSIVLESYGQEARRRWERMCEIRRQKFDLILPEVMRENGIDMWITMMKEGNPDPLYEDLGRGYTGSKGYYIFTDRGGDRIERIAIGISGYMLKECGVYDQVLGEVNLRKFVQDRNPKTIGINISDHIGAADGLSHSSYEFLKKELGETYASRLKSAEKLVSDFRSRRVASELVAFGEAGELTRQITETALSNEVITPGVTTLEDVAWWIQDQVLAKGLQTSFDMPSVYITGPKGIEAISNTRIIQRGDFMMTDWGLGYLNMYTDVKRVAYVLKEGEIAAPKNLTDAYTTALSIRDILRKNILPGKTAAATYKILNKKIEEAGFAIMKEFNKPSGGDAIDVIVGCHSVGNLGHGIGPSIAFFNPRRLQFEIKPNNLFSIEYFVYIPLPEWGGAKVRIPIEDDGVATTRGIEWLYPVAERILLIK